MESLGNFKCQHCGWVHVGISKSAAIAAVAEFNEYFAKLGPDAQADFGGQPSSLDSYKRCFKCGASAAHFTPAAPEDLVIGRTLQVVIAPTDVK